MAATSRSSRQVMAWISAQTLARSMSLSRYQKIATTSTSENTALAAVHTGEERLAVPVPALSSTIAAPPVIFRGRRGGIGQRHVQPEPGECHLQDRWRVLEQEAAGASRRTLHALPGRATVRGRRTCGYGGPS